ncbi:hypothetical protein CDAR_220371 [Caerostris darwini]|uniref:Uncharacterized protein n=1 Tax=Caerostris darwini TaxID=1538125 RepID=A0AAV4UFG0_9ARAC|nr:hypothetical protein CDAR_220371 [Caerostris darwini]
MPTSSLSFVFQEAEHLQQQVGSRQKSFGEKDLQKWCVLISCGIWSETGVSNNLGRKPGVCVGNICRKCKVGGNGYFFPFFKLLVLSVSPCPNSFFSFIMSESCLTFVFQEAERLQQQVASCQNFFGKKDLQRWCVVLISSGIGGKTGLSNNLGRMLVFVVRTAAGVDEDICSVE